MNEQKKSYQSYVNPTQNKWHQEVAEAESLARLLLSHRNKLSITERFYIDNVLKQLGQRNAHISNKVLRGMKAKLTSIQAQIQR